MIKLIFVKHKLFNFKCLSLIEFFLIVSDIISRYFDLNFSLLFSRIELIFSPFQFIKILLFVFFSSKYSSKINKSIISISDQRYFKHDYYNYTLSVLKFIINKNNLSINIILGCHEYNFENKNKTIKININYEHTLVKEGGRGVEKNTPIGKIKYSQNKYYLVRIDSKKKYFGSSDVIIDYSNPNIYNVKKSGLYNNFSDKHIYLAPNLYEKLHININNRNIQSLTTFINTDEPRRKKLLEKISQSRLKHINKNDCKYKEGLKKLYQLCH